MTTGEIKNIVDTAINAFKEDMVLAMDDINGQVETARTIVTDFNAALANKIDSVVAEHERILGAKISTLNT